MMRLPPLPWTYVTIGGPGDPGHGHVYIVDANNRKIASIWGKAQEKIAFAEAVCDLSERLSDGRKNGDTLPHAG
jgi:hypothetical protein